MGENFADAVITRPDVIHSVENPYRKTGGIAVLKGNIAPDCSVVKESAVAEEMLVHSGPAKSTIPKMKLLRQSAVNK